MYQPARVNNDGVVIAPERGSKVITQVVESVSYAITVIFLAIKGGIRYVADNAKDDHLAHIFAGLLIGAFIMKGLPDGWWETGFLILAFVLYAIAIGADYTPPVSGP
jgi:hypothetical protein